MAKFFVPSPHHKKSTEVGKGGRGVVRHSPARIGGHGSMGSIEEKQKKKMEEGKGERDTF